MYESFQSVVLKDIEKEGNTYLAKEYVLGIKDAIIPHEISTLYANQKKLKDLRYLYVLGCMIVQSKEIPFQKLAEDLQKGKSVFNNGQGLIHSNADLFDICRPLQQEGPVIENLVFLYREFTPEEIKLFHNQEKGKTKGVQTKKPSYCSSHPTVSTVMKTFKNTRNIHLNEGNN